MQTLHLKCGICRDTAPGGSGFSLRTTTYDCNLPHARERCPPLEYSLALSRLAPVPFHHHPAVLLVIPAMRYPAGARPRRLFPLSRGPGVRVAIPPLIPGNPDMGIAGRRRPLFDYNTRGRDLNHNIGRYRAEGQRPCKNQSDQSLHNHNTFSFFESRTVTNPTANGLE